MSRVVSTIIYLIIGLAVIGVFNQLLTNTASFLTSIFIMIGIGVAIFVAVYFIFIRNRTSGNEMKKYKQAVKQSKKKYSNSEADYSPSSSKKQPTKSRKRSKKHATHLRVIEGNKSKKKRASN